MGNELRIVQIAIDYCRDPRLFKSGEIYGVGVNGAVYRFDREELGWVQLPMRIIRPRTKEAKRD